MVLGVRLVPAFTTAVQVYKKLPLERLWDRFLVLHAGEFELERKPAGPANVDTSSGTGPHHMALYHALNRNLEGRLGLLQVWSSHLEEEGLSHTHYLTLPPSLKCMKRFHAARELDDGVLSAPVGCVTVAFMNVVGTQVRG